MLGLNYPSQYILKLFDTTKVRLAIAYPLLSFKGERYHTTRATYYYVKYFRFYLDIVLRRRAESVVVNPCPLLPLTLLQEAVNISVQVNTKVQMHDTFNVLCYTDEGKADSIIVVSLS